jgi:AraC-like DNA-binding protein/quercetin dioxygenase-like cupin family protein
MNPLTNYASPKTPFRRVLILPDESFHFLEFRGANQSCSWHFHPEYQLGVVLRGSGKRVIGDSVRPIRAGEVTLLGANLPHVWHYHRGRRGDATHALVVHFSDNFLGSEFLKKPELRDINLLLARAKLGLEAQGATRGKAALLLRAMGEHEGFDRVLDLLSLLNLLAGSTELTTLCSSGFEPLAAEPEIERLRRVCEHIEAHFGEALDRDTLARIAHLSPSSFSRFFKAHTGKTFWEFVTEVRVGHACRLLQEEEDHVTEIALRCGFVDGTSFDRSFRRVKSMSPRQFRQFMKEATSGED